MPIFDCSLEMTDYHKDEVTLQKAGQKKMRERRDAGRTRLCNGLRIDNYPQPKEIASQGSYAMRTMVQDSESDYDIDDGVYFNKEDLKNEDQTELTPLQARQRICSALKQDERLKHPAEVHNNCVRQRYPEGYHIDVPIYRVTKTTDKNGNVISEFELASKNKWVLSDARAVTSWFNGLVGNLNEGELDGSQMRRITKLSKKFARRNEYWKEKTASGICITKLVVECFEPKSGRDDDSLHATWTAIDRRLRKSLRIQHPVLSDTYLADEGDESVNFFHQCVTDALADLQILTDKNCSKKKGLEAWDKVFASAYFGGKLIVESSTKSSLLRAAIPATQLTFPDKPIIPNKPAGFA